MDTPAKLLKVLSGPASDVAAFLEILSIVDSDDGVPRDEAFS